MDGRDLRRLFDEFNRRYFSGRLPNIESESYHTTQTRISIRCLRRIAAP